MQPDPNALPEKNLDLFYALDKHLKDEDRSILHIRDAEEDIAAFLRRRADENLNPQLTISLFDRNRIAETTIELDTVFINDLIKFVLINQSHNLFSERNKKATESTRSYYARDERFGTVPGPNRQSGAHQ